MHTRTFAALVLLFVVLPVPGSAQTPDGSPRRQAVFERLEDSQLVRLAAPGLGRREGRVLERSAIELVLTADPEPLRLPATTVDTLWTRGGSAKVGAIVGGIVGVGLGALAGTEFGEENAGSAKNVLGMAAIGAIGGSLLGAIIGAPLRRWHRRFP